MKKWLLVLMVLSFAVQVNAVDIRLRKYGQATTIDFELYEVDGVDLRTDAADDNDECSIRKDGGNEATCTNDFVDEGITYSLLLSATEMEAERIIVDIIDDTAPKTWLDRVIIIETYGNASAEHALDLDDATPTVNVTEIDATAAATVLEAEAVDALESFELDNLLSVSTGVATDGDLEAFVSSGSVMAHLMGEAADVTLYKASTDAMSLGNATAAGIADAVWDELTADHKTAATFGALMMLINLLP